MLFPMATKFTDVIRFDQHQHKNSLSNQLLLEKTFIALQKRDREKRFVLEFRLLRNFSSKECRKTKQLTRRSVA